MRTVVDANRLWVDSSARALALRRYEVPLLERLGGPLDGGAVVDVGCGRRGAGARAALARLGADRVVAVDVHAASVEESRRRLADVADRVRLDVADASRRLPVDDASVDGVLCLHVLHHAEDWAGVLREAARVLRPGGRLWGAEMDARFVDAAPLRLVSRHPRSPRPTPERVRAALQEAGLRPRSCVSTRGRLWFGWTAGAPA